MFDEEGSRIQRLIPRLHLGFGEMIEISHTGRNYPPKGIRCDLCGEKITWRDFTFFGSLSSVGIPVFYHIVCKEWLDGVNLR